MRDIFHGDKHRPNKAYAASISAPLTATPTCSSPSYRRRFPLHTHDDVYDDRHTSTTLTIFAATFNHDDVFFRSWRIPLKWAFRTCRRTVDEAIAPVPTTFGPRGTAYAVQMARHAWGSVFIHAENPVVARSECLIEVTARCYRALIFLRCSGTSVSLVPFFLCLEAHGLYDIGLCLVCCESRFRHSNIVDVHVLTPNFRRARDLLTQSTPRFLATEVRPFPSGGFSSG